MDEESLSPPAARRSAGRAQIQTVALAVGSLFLIPGITRPFDRLGFPGQSQVMLLGIL